MKRWNDVYLDEAKRTMSRDSENARSHPIKPVTRSACASREPDAIDDLFERSLLHWCFTRLRITSSCSFGSSTLLHFDLKPESQLRVLRSVLSTMARSEMAGSVDVKSLGQFSTNRIILAKQVLEDSANAVITSIPPAPFLDTRI